MSGTIQEDVICNTCGVLTNIEQAHECYPDEVDIAAINREEEREMEAMFMHDNFFDGGELPF